MRRSGHSKRKGDQCGSCDQFSDSRAKTRDESRLRRPQPEKFTLAQAFDYFWEPSGHPSEDVNLERAVRAVGFLLHWCSDMGNDPLEGHSAHGLGHILEFTADQITQAFGDQRRELAELRSVVQHLMKKE